VLKPGGALPERTLADLSFHTALYRVSGDRSETALVEYAPAVFRAVHGAAAPDRSAVVQPCPNPGGVTFVL
jgi:hypothetical protein